MLPSEFSELARGSASPEISQDRPPGMPSRTKIVIVTGLIALFFVLLLGVAVAPPGDFPTNHALVIEKGLSVEDIGKHLKDQNYIRSAKLFVFFSVLTNADHMIRSGSYVFQQPRSIFGIIRALQNGENRGQVRVTFPEGITASRMGSILEDVIPHIDAEEFAKQAQEHEGYLFPDTYFIGVEMGTDEIITVLRETFEKKTRPLKETAEKQGKDWEDVVIMASILEGEVAAKKDRRIISGILWKRIDIGMPLQVDAPFLYILEKGSLELTQEELEIDSPYNTYRYRGLPPTPINNPGIDAFSATLVPEESPYLFYLSDKEGTIHYARTHDEHVENKRRYLR